MKAIETTATVKYVLETKQITEKFSKRSIIVEVPDGQHPQVLEFEATGDKIPLLDGIGAGDTVTITWNLRGREKKNNDGAFVSLAIWKINVDTKAAVRSSGGSSQDSIPFRAIK